MNWEVKPSWTFIYFITPCVRGVLYRLRISTVVVFNNMFSCWGHTCSIELTTRKVYGWGRHVPEFVRRDWTKVREKIPLVGRLYVNRSRIWDGFISVHKKQFAAFTFFLRGSLYKKNGILRAVGKVKVKGKGKGVPRIGHEGPEGGVDSYLYSFFNLSARWGGGVVNTTPRSLYPRDVTGTHCVPQGWYGRVRKNLAPSPGKHFKTISLMA